MPAEAEAPRPAEFEDALARALEEGEAVEGLWQVTPLGYALGLLQLSRFLKLAAIPALIAGAYALHGLLQRAGPFWSLRLPSEWSGWLCLAVGALLIGFCLYMAVTETLRVMTARYALTPRRWISFQNVRGQGWGAKSLALARCAWRVERRLLLIFERSPRGTIRECLPAIGLHDMASLVAALERLAGPSLEREACRALERQHEAQETAQSEAALVPVFRKPVAPAWSARAPFSLGRVSRGELGAYAVGWGGIGLVLLRPATPQRWLVWGLVTVVLPLVSLLRGRWLRWKETAPTRCVAADHWWALQHRRGPRDHYAVARGLPLRGLPYRVHDDAVYVPHAPVELDASWTEGDADALALLGDALPAPTDPGAFDPQTWHRLQPVQRGLLAALDAAGAQATSN